MLYELWKSPSHRIIQLYATSTTNNPTNPKRWQKHNMLSKHSRKQRIFKKTTNFILQHLYKSNHKYISFSHSNSKLMKSVGWPSIEYRCYDATRTYVCQWARWRKDVCAAHHPLSMQRNMETNKQLLCFLANFSNIFLF